MVILAVLKIFVKKKLFFVFFFQKASEPYGMALIHLVVVIRQRCVQCKIVLEKRNKTTLSSLNVTAYIVYVLP